MPLLIAAVTKLNRLAHSALGRRDDGQDLLEYAVLVALIVMIALGAVTAVGNTINTVFWSAIAASNV